MSFKTLSECLKKFEEMFAGHCDGSVSEEEETDASVPFINHFLTATISASNNQKAEYFYSLRQVLIKVVEI